MRRNRHINSKRWLTSAAASLTAFANTDRLPALSYSHFSPGAFRQEPLSLGQYSFQYDGILGTSLDLLVGAVRASDAHQCEQQVLAEIERLRRILSTYDPQSEISLVKSGASIASRELAELLQAYAIWSERTSGAINVNMAEVIHLWKDAARTGRAPLESALQAALDTPLAWNVDALGKGYIVDCAVAVARRFAPSGLLNIGGDIRTWGGDSWPISIAQPLDPAENARPAAIFSLRDGAVATSGSYARVATVAGQRHSHIIDPRTLRPADQVLSATFTAPDCLTANALATAACVLGKPNVAILARLVGAAEYFIMDAVGGVAQTAGIEAVDLNALASTVSDKPSTNQPAGAAWPTNHLVTVNISLKAQPGGRGKRPYLAVWVEDSKKKLVRTVTLWGNNWKWLPELTGWWRAAGSYDDNFARSQTRATRAPGQYSLSWDGLDDRGKPLPAGDYKIFVEINREHGRHVVESATITCGPEPQSMELRGTVESEASKIEYGPKSK